MNELRKRDSSRPASIGASRGAVALGLACLLVAAAADTRAQETAPEILRGTPAPPPEAVAVPAPGEGAQTVAAGNRVWFIDRNEGTLVGCRLINTSYVGAERIECSARDLPEAAR